MKNLEAAALEVAWGIVNRTMSSRVTEAQLLERLGEVYPKVLAVLPKKKTNYLTRNPKN